MVHPVCHCPFQDLSTFASLVAGCEVNGAGKRYSDFCNAHLNLQQATDAYWTLTQVTSDLRDAMDTLAVKSTQMKWCVPGVLATSYACIVAAHFGEFDGTGLLEFLLPVMEGILVPAAIAAAACTPIAGEVLYRYDRFRRVQLDFRSQREVFISTFKRLCRRDFQLPFCGEGRTLFGCRDAFETLHLFFPGTGNQMDSPSLSLCSHAPLDEVASASLQLKYEGPVSLALLASTGETEAKRLATAWMKRHRRRSSTTLSLVFLKSQNSSYDQRWLTYPAGILRKVAVKAAISDFVLLSEPGFFPNTVLQGEVFQAAKLLMREKSIFILPAIEVQRTSTPKLRHFSAADLKEMVSNGTAECYERKVCPLIRSHAWQWTILDQSRRFREVPSGDFLSPGILAKRDLLADLEEVGLQGVIPAWKGDMERRRGLCSGLPKIVRATLDLLEVNGVTLLLLPKHFMWRSAGFRLQVMQRPAASWKEVLHPGLDFEIMYSMFLHNLWEKGHWKNEAPGMNLKSLPSITHKDFEVVENRNPNEWLWTLKEVEGSRIQLLLPASSIIGSFWLDRLIRDVPWTVHALAVGARSFWTALLQEMPFILGQLSTKISANGVMMILDAYDMAYVSSCPVDILTEYYRHGKDILISSEGNCEPEAVRPCPACEDEECRSTKSQYLNSGGVMGTAEALSHAFAWMAEHTPNITPSDQGAWILYQKAFPDRVGLEYHPRIWVSLLGTRTEDFAVRNGRSCGIVYMRRYNGTRRNDVSPVCFLHGNGDSKLEHFPELVQRMDMACGRPVSVRAKPTYQGIPMRSFTLQKVAPTDAAFSAMPNLRNLLAK